MRRVTIPVLATLGLLAVAALPAGLFAQGHPNIAVGLSPESAYDSAGIDNIGLFGGALTVGPIHIGPRYTVSSTLNYGLSATLANNIWDYDPVPGGPFIAARPSRLFNAGLGWTISMGELYHPNYVYNNTDDWLYIDSSGGAHKLYEQLHAWEDDGAPGVRYTRDNSFIRMVELGDFNWQRIETPDGLMRTFVKRGSRFRLETIEDRYGNWVKIAYSEAGQLPAPPDPYDEQQRITDSQGRTHYVYMIDRPWTGLTIDMIDFEGPGGGRLAWTFDHWVQNRDRSCKDTDPGNTERIAVPLLIRINRPDGSKFEMVDGSQPAYWDGCDGGMYDRPGMLKKITLPTGGSVTYDYQRYDFPGGGYPPDYYQSATGVKTRKAFDRDGSLISTTAYSYFLDTPNNEMQMRVLSPTGECSRHFFAAKPDPSPSSDAGWDYGLPYSRRFTSGGRFLSSEVWTGHNGSVCTGTKLRSAYVTFDHDPLPNLGGNPSNWYNTNRRLSGSRTVFHDGGDRYIDTALTSYDGVGHYRTATTTSSIGFTPTRTVTTSFNPGRQPWTPWPVGNPWILGTFNSTQASVSEAVGETVAKMEYQFDSGTGALTCQRVLKLGTSRSGDDIVTEYLRTGAGNVWQVRTRGGDGAGLGTGGVCAGSGGAGANYGYTAGVVKTVRPLGTDGSALTYFSYDADVDPGTGRVTATRSPSGLQTSYSYDALGRVTTVTPQEGASSSTTYTHATTSGPAKIRTTVTGAGSTLSESEVIFDGLGRAVERRRRVPDHGWVSTFTTYDASSRVVSQTLANDPAKRVQYLQYDPFGRPAVIRPPEGAGHDVLLSYGGVGSTTRQVKVGTAQGEVYQTWVNTYDGLGRLRIVIEPGAQVGEETGETLRAGYGYDVAGRLTQVRTVDGASGVEQVREFVYDNRGFLLEESHPELNVGIVPVGSFRYFDYDVFGNPGRVANPSRDLKFTYDPFGRLTQVRDGQNNDLPVKAFFYDIAAGAGKGKLAEARRHNRVTLPGGGTENVIVNEIYSYEGVAGAMSSRRTTISRGGLQFEEQYQYDAAGQLTGLTYPDCLHAGCGSDIPDRMTDFTYNLGHLRQVGGFTGGSIAYHADGSWATIPHANGVTDYRSVQTSNPGRTARLYSQGASTNYNSGSFSYDGAGHITQMGTQSFAYDAVGRLVTKTLNGTLPEWEYEYDAFGNLKSHTQYDVGGFVEQRTFAINVQKNRLASASYDGAGNLLSWGGGMYGYDPAGNLQSVGAATVHLYTASDERIATLHSPGKGSPLEEAYTLRSAAGQVLREVARDDGMPNGALVWNRDYAWRGGQLLATVQPTTSGGQWKWHYTLNHVGSPVLVTKGDGTTQASYEHAPFGEDMSSSNPPGPAGMPMRFTGHERDFRAAGTLDDLDYMHARQYTPYVGRFLQVDPVLGSPGSPQSWNRYAYVGNDPVNFTDPTGLGREGEFNQDACEDYWFGSTCDAYGRHPDRDREDAHRHHCELFPADCDDGWRRDRPNRPERPTPPDDPGDPDPTDPPDPENPCASGAVMLMGANGSPACTPEGTEDPNDPFRCPDGPLCELTKPAPEAPTVKPAPEGWRQSCSYSAVMTAGSGIAFIGSTVGVGFGCAGAVATGGALTPGCVGAIAGVGWSWWGMVDNAITMGERCR